MNVLFGVLKYIFDAALLLVLLYLVLLIRRRID